MSLPNPPEVKGPLNSWLRKLAYEVRGEILQPGVGYRINRTAGGKSLIIDPTIPAPLEDFHPFKIYNFPRYLRTYQNDDDWQRFKVHGGFVTYANTAVATPSQTAVYGTDFNQEGYRNYNRAHDFLLNQTPPNSNAQWAANWSEVVVPADQATYYFWISLMDTGLGTLPLLLFGEDVANAIEMDGGTSQTDYWPDFPADDPYHIMIGSVFILSDNTIRIEQYQRGNIVIDSRVMRFRGEYDANADYYMYDVVTSTSGATVHQFIFHSDATYDIADGPISGVAPGGGNTPDPWKVLSKSTYP